jgi:PAS domain S-box-containing protein
MTELNVTQLIDRIALLHAEVTRPGVPNDVVTKAALSFAQQLTGLSSVALESGTVEVSGDAGHAAAGDEAERSLKLDAPGWRSLVEQNISGIYLLENGRFVYANERFLQMVGYTADELRALPSTLDIVDETDRATAQERLRARWSGEARDVQYELTCIRGDDGRPVRLEVFTTTVFVDGVQRIIGTAIDVTARHAADLALRRSEEWLRSFIENGFDMIGLLTLDAVYTYCNQSVRRHLGYEPSDLIGRSAFELIHPDDLPRIQRELQQLPLREGRSSTTRLRFRHATLGWRECEVRMRIERDPQGDEIIVVNARDVTDEHRFHQQIASAERLAALGRVASSMAHEFNNVLMAIQPFADLISRVRDPERLHTAATAITNAVRRGRTITQQVLRFTRGEPPERRAIPMQTILTSVQREVSQVMPANVRLHIVQPDHELFTFADPSQIEQLLVNLTLNARDAMPDGGPVTISVEAATSREYAFGVLPRTGEDYVHISIADGGTGIPPELLPRIFEPFFTMRKAQGGSGLGLTIAQQIAVAHEGALFVESQVGAGTTFHLFIPRVEPSITIPDGPRVDFLMIKRIMLVEDDDAVAEGVVTALEAMTFDTHRVATGAAAIGGVESFHPDVVLLDYGLPDITGAQVFSALRERWPNLPIVFATGHADALALRREVGDANVEICFKPFNTNRLLEAISRAIAT